MGAEMVGRTAEQAGGVKCQTGVLPQQHPDCTRLGADRASQVPDL